MFLIDIPIQLRIYVGIAAMLVLFASFIVAMIIAQRKKLQFHRERQRLMQEQQDMLTAQNKLLEQKVAERTHELDVKNHELEKSLIDLRNTQEQLIQREKLASLGELTAGIAHEIKNPLNFVNNFSDVSAELVDELQTAVKQGNSNEAMHIAADLRSNLEKIANHGRRADSIVKGMLSHARSTTTSSELTNMNILVEECIQLSYQGFRARKKGFSADIVTHYDSSNPSIVVNPQEIGRGIINICNNALYAIEERSRMHHEENYQPQIEVTTQVKDSNFVIEIGDNGTGIDDAILSKLFQPFFTTKPTGEGTGLGLSMTYDIITNGHSGTLSVSSSRGKGTRFTITLPLKRT